MSVTLAGFTLAAIGGVTMVPGHAGLAVFTRCEVLALLAHVVVDACAVPVTLAGWAVYKRPLIVFLSGTQASIQNHLTGVPPLGLHRTPG